MIETLSMEKTIYHRYQKAQIFIKDLDSRYIYANESFLSFYNLSHIDQIYHKTDYELPWDKYAEEYIQHDEEAIRAGELQVIERSIKKNRGHDSLLLSHKYPFYDQKTKQSGMIGIATELTDNVIKGLNPFIDTQEIECLKFSNNLFNKQVNQHAQIPLTTRELDVFYYILHGLSQKQVATRLNLSVRTVEDYIDHIKIKLHCHHKHQLFEFAINAGLMNIIPRKLDANV